MYQERPVERVAEDIVGGGVEVDRRIDARNLIRVAAAARESVAVPLVPIRQVIWSAKEVVLESTSR